ncbi:MAG: hypothetical protein COX80_04785 [Candidatus Magasanikbacteria bacterium CG_4_10_14_0_2_um_filter_33_14]|uniref:Glycosyltransferase 2-like domain-containing protein n=1 Tax=Candidatus Magasanikbacteria bacterium CG_4_10_14_0_2_um_filter_33_14 TaxID=1974636 RepID=A0A2M7V8W1_9BACT|nr:MAG: hypothetical protein COX80_04785 [Candidatus Magasanikbacteria bacterium CG_4_10_14_0_2_um_filter_33_14]
MKDINIVIVNYNMKDKIAVCLETLFFDLQKNNLDVCVTVVDNHSEDGSIQFLKEKFPQVNYIEQEKNFGFGKSQNKGIKHCEAKYYFILNPDTIFHKEKNTIQKLFDFMENNPKIGMIGTKLVYPDGSLQYSCWRYPSFFQPFFQRTKLGKTKWGKKKIDHHHMKDFDHNNTIPVDAIMGSSMFVRKEAVDDAGMFDERYFMYYEDIDWSMSMWEKGWPVYYVHDIVLTHIHGRGSAEVPGVFKALFKNKLARIHVQSWLKFLWKWRGKQKYYAIKYK